MLEKTTKMAVLAAIGSTALALVAAPIMSLAVLGHLSIELLGMNAALTAGFSINILAVPVHLAGQAFGVLRWNFVSQVAMASAVLIGAFLVGPTYGANGLISTMVAGLLLGMLTVLLGNACAFHVMDIVRKLSWQLFSAGLVIAVLCLAAAIAAWQTGY
jgi:hypothetical protein